MIKLFRKDSISDSTCDKIERERRIYLFDTIKLPVFIKETSYAEYEILPKTLTRQEAMKKAENALLSMSEEALTDAEILGKHITVTENENSLSLTWQVECIVNIAEEIKIETG